MMYCSSSVVWYRSVSTSCLRTPTSRSKPFPIAFSPTTTGNSAVWIARINGDTYSTVRAARCSASAFGTISPITMCRYVRKDTATTLATA